MDDMNIEYSVNCSRDFVEVLDGSDGSAVSLGKFCGPLSSAIKVTSSSNEVLLRFVSSRLTTRKGFKLQYSALRTGAFLGLVLFSVAFPI